MLQLNNIKKSYTIADFTQHALDGVTVAFRDNEFAAVLGPSGSGKTTLLNIVGGLDQYDSGDLEIDGISTKNYKASDWDTYRNNRIGFVFQSYNLIPHQSVLANVELALTLIGVSKKERRRRAKDALVEVGLGDHIRKKPTQLSGGQMQRVALARALINDPEILLADEPTGALDSTTSLQVMELLTKIAKDRLVIMVTHNNALAKKYANRTIELTDGKVTSDSRPYDPATEERRHAEPPRRSRMSFWTAISLSFSNLMTKKGRTFTTAFAGSIGIIGIAVILSFSNGINAYIKSIEEDTLSVYPLSIQEQSFDLSGFFGGSDGDGEGGQARRERPEGTVREIHVMEAAFSSQSLNDLASLKTHIDENMDALEPYVTTIQYTYSVTPQIYLADTSNGIDKINPDSIFSTMMEGNPMASGAGAMGFALPTNSFYELPNEPNLYESQYEMLAGRWPESHDEAVLVLQFGNAILDYTLYSIGIRDRAEMRAMLESVVQGSGIEIEISESEGFYTYETLMASGFKVVNPADVYQYDEIFEIWVDKSGDAAFMEELLEKSMDLKIVGIVQPEQDAQTAVLQAGVNYTPDLIYHLIEAAAETPIVKEQMANPEVNVVTGNTFEYEKDNPQTSFDFSKIISVDEDVFTEAMGMDALMDVFNFEGMDLGDLDMSNFDMSGFDMGSMGGFSMGGMNMGSIDMSGMMGGLENLDLAPLMEDLMEELSFEGIFDDVPLPSFDDLDMTALIGAIEGSGFIAEGEMAAIMGKYMPGLIAAVLGAAESTPGDWEAIWTVATDYLASIDEELGEELMAAIDVTALQNAIAEALQEIIATAMQEYMVALGTAIDGAIQAAIGTMMQRMTVMIGQMMEEMMQSVMNQIASSIRGAMGSVAEELAKQIQSSVEEVMEEVMTQVAAQIEETMTQMFEDMAAEMEAAMDGFDGDALAEAFQIDLSEETIYELMTAMMNPSTTSYEQNLSLMGYADTGKPSQVAFYPRSFEAKQHIVDFLDSYNAEMERTDPDKVVYYIDLVGLMMSSVTSIIDMVSYALVAFVSVSLVVSSIMIGVITFVSVLERKKEIGILRAVGASKGNIRLVFNAETLIIGFVAGIIGVLVTFLVAFIANAIIWDRLAIRQLVLILPTVPAMMVGISVLLTYIAGLIPASAAAAKPPVEALRSE